MNIEILKDTMQDSNINFLLGSGLSSPYLPLLGNIETLLTEVERAVLTQTQKKIIKVSLYKRYFDAVIARNTKILKGDPGSNPVLSEYKRFLQCLNSLLLKRKVTILSKEVNLFTTNIDIFLEKALDELNLEFNDGFNGRFKPLFSLSNFKICRFKKSLHYDKSAELPVFNLMKLHGSLSWELGSDDSVIFSVNLQQIADVAAKTLPADHFIDIPDDATLASLIPATATKVSDAATDAFMNAYEKLLIIVNPTKEKFQHTLMNATYYELLRLYSNELEKENTTLFAMGFSFADEHVRDITIRAANSNPTLVVHVVAYSSEAREQIQTRFPSTSIRNANIKFHAPEQEDDGHGNKTDKFSYDFSKINDKLLGAILNSVDAKN
jgi:hypothetical protein